MNVISALIFGLIIGWVIEWLIDWFYWRRKGKAHRLELAAEREKIDRLNAELAESQRGQSKSDRQMKELKVQLAEAELARSQLDAQVAGNQELYDRLADAEAQNQKLKNQLADHDRDREELAASQSQIAQLRSKLAQYYKSPTKKAESLEEIHGIGASFAQRLNDAGVYSYADLAQLSPDRVREIVAAKKWHRINPEAWIAEAKQRVAEADQAAKGGRS